MLYLDGHVTGDGLVAGLLLCRAVVEQGRPLADLAGVMPRYPQVKENVRVRSKAIPASILEEAARLATELDGRGRVLVRPSGTEPVVRVLAEAETEVEARRLCATHSDSRSERARLDTSAGLASFSVSFFETITTQKAGRKRDSQIGHR